MKLTVPQYRLLVKLLSGPVKLTKILHTADRLVFLRLAYKNRDNVLSITPRGRARI